MTRLVSSRRKPLKEPRSVHGCCAYAIDLLKRIGFEKAYVSMKSEAVYFKFPGRHGVLRVATHPTKRGAIGLDNIVAKLTFRGNSYDDPEMMRCSDEKVDSMIWLAIGQYMVNSAVERPRQYTGPKSAA